MMSSALLDRSPHTLDSSDYIDCSDLDACIFSDGACLELSAEAQAKLLDGFIRQSVAHHLKHCPQYEAFARKRGWSAEQLDRPDWLERIPLIPTSVFKRETVLSCDPRDVAQWCFSSGTRGPRSRIGRDQATIERLLGSVLTGMPLLGRWYDHEVEFLNLGPPAEAAGDVWFPYVMSLLELRYSTISIVKNEVADYALAIRSLSEMLARSPFVVLTGPPAMLLRLLSAIESSRQTLAGAERMLVVTAGGWKRHTGESIPRTELEERACQTLGLRDTVQVRDAFNQVELNTVFLECSAKRKHVPPWVYAAAREPETLAVQPAGSSGILSYLDASATSYPAFVLCEDVGSVTTGKCACGREGTSVSIERRMTGRIARGCALSMDRLYDSADNAQ